MTRLLKRPAPAARGGRPRIGPKLQTSTPEEWYTHMEAEAKERGVKVAVVAREVIIQGCAARYGGQS
jgi:hypothetical protein